MRCMCIKTVKDFLIGEIYDVNILTSELYSTLNNKGIYVYMPKIYFKPISEIRDEHINSILINN